jgi:hypothetical protein
MNLAVNVALAVGPLAAYFVMMGVLHGARRPTVVPGPLDFALLAIGLGGVLVFGPVGRMLVDRLFPGPSLWAWLALASAYGLLALLWGPRSARRLVIYHIGPEELRQAVREALLVVPGSFSPTIRGFEDADHSRGLTFEVGDRLRAGVIEAYGREAEALVAALGPVLRERLREVRTRPSRLASIWFAVAALTLILPYASLWLGRSPVFEALRAWLQGLGRP